jgi:predicted phage terminase large subunit-like protein
VVAVDPAISANPESDETGIVAAAIQGVGKGAHGYVLRDLSGRYSPNAWAKKAVDLYRELGADRIVAEGNQGGEMVRQTLKSVDANVPVKIVHASRGKQARAEPVAALYEEGRIHHVGALQGLEDQMTSWVPGEGDSPDRVDALVWAMTELMLSGSQANFVNVKLAG